MRKSVIFLFCVGLLIFSGCTGEEQIDYANPTVPKEIDVTYAKGNANAKVVITEYSEYQCPFCARFTLDVLPQLQNDYLETGKVKFVFKDFPIPNHKYAQMTSEATYCAGEQNEEAFWKMHVKLYENQKDLTKEAIIRYAQDAGLNDGIFKACLESGKYKTLVLRNRQDGLNAGVNATPTLFINDTKIVGVQPYENLVKIIETELKK
ncbi:DsbA family protein [Candidatus Peregrinibacteria bacterium]|nr:DsbA family protein [Candidatus Peregrinibacteria bacterium]